MNLPPAREGAEKTWVLRGLSAAKVELTRGGAQGGLVAFNFPRADRWRNGRPHLLCVRIGFRRGGINFMAKHVWAGQFVAWRGWSRHTRHPHDTGSNFSGLCIARLGWVRQRSAGSGSARLGAARCGRL